MDFLFVNTEELNALMELPLAQRVTYLMGIRPYMDRETCVVGIKRKISYQSLSEVLYVEPHQGIQSGRPNKQQLRRIINGLQRAGLIEVQSTSKNLILKCLLASWDDSVQNKLGTKPTPHPDISFDKQNPGPSTNNEGAIQKADRGEIAKADTPHNSEDNCVYLRASFEKFWESYPEKKNKRQAWDAFKKINPDEALFSQILSAVHAQTQYHEQQEAAGFWVPRWKYPANWLTSRAWENDITAFKQQETLYAQHKKRSAKQPVDFYWESCKGGLDYVPDDETSTRDNVIPFKENETY